MKAPRWALTLACALAASSATAQGAKGTFKEANTTFTVIDAFAWEEPHPYTPLVKNIHIWLADKALDHKALAAAKDLRAALERVKSDVGLVELEVDSNGEWRDIAWVVPTSMCGSCLDGLALEKAALAVAPAGVVRGTIKVKATDHTEGKGFVLDLALDLPIEKRFKTAIRGPIAMPGEASQPAAAAEPDAAEPEPAAAPLTPEAARQQLAAKGVDLKNTRIALMMFVSAAMAHDVAQVQAFLDAGASPNDRRDPPQSDTPLLSAVFPGCNTHQGATGVAIVKAMLAHGADANAVADNGNPVLNYAADACPAEVVEALVRGGAKMTARNRSGYDAMKMAISSDRTATVRTLLALGYPVWNDRPALLEAAEGKPEILALLKPPAPERRPAAARKKKT